MRIPKQVQQCAGRIVIQALVACFLFVVLQIGLPGTDVPGARPEVAYASDDAATVAPITLTLVTSGLANPVYLTHAPDGSGRMFVVEQAGVIRILENGSLLSDPFLDIQGPVNSVCGECGLLGLAFPPDYAESGVFYVNYTATGNPAQPADPDEPDGMNDTVIARYSVSANPNVADAGSETRILVINQPHTNHNGGQISFGPDGTLYIGMGDGGGQNDPLDSARNPASLLGKMLRIQVSSTGTYTVPSDNPFVGASGYRPEIWATGLRNPWRWSFDRQTGDLYVGDVGQGAFEEIDFQPASSAGGEDYGWDVMEGFSCFNDPDESGDNTGCDQSGLTLPIHDYPHRDGQAVTGGFVYRGGYAALNGVYLYGDYESRRMWALHKDGDEWVNEDVLSTPYNISSFGEDEAGELYVVDRSGSIYRIDSAAPNPPQPLDYKFQLPLVLREEATQEP